MGSKIKNIIIFASIGVAMVLVYVFFLAPGEEEAAIAPGATNTENAPVAAAGDATAGSPYVGQDFVTLLLNVQNIKLNDSIFSDPAFLSLHDSTIILTPDGSEGRPNPFAPIGVDMIVPPTLPNQTTSSGQTN